MSEVKIIAASIVNFLKQQLEGEILSNDSRESVEVGVQCIETAFELAPGDISEGVDLVQLLRQQKGNVEQNQIHKDAEHLKCEGNELLKANRFREAIEKYTRAIQIYPQNSVYYCNRAAAHHKIGDNEACVTDCRAAIAINPNYSKAYGRLGLALMSLDRLSEARQAYARASQLEPENESYKENMRHIDETLTQGGETGSSDLRGLLQNPGLLNMATEMLTDPTMQNLISGFMRNVQTPDGTSVGTLLEAGPAIAQQMHANPDLLEQLRRQFEPPGPGGNNPPSSQ